MKTKFKNVALIVLLCIVGFQFVKIIITNQSLVLNDESFFIPMEQDEQIDFMKKVFTQADSFRLIKYKEEYFYHVFQDSIPLGYAKFIDQDLECSSCNNVRYLCTLNNDFGVSEILLISDLDRKRVYDKIIHVEDAINKKLGKKLFDIVNINDFINQIKVNPQSIDEIDAISGATKTSNAIFNGTNEFILEAKHYSKYYSGLLTQKN